MLSAMDRISCARMWLGGLAVASCAVFSVGCANPLFPKDMPRTPYDRYLALRGESRPQVEVDVNGRERPALRRRLAPLDTP